MMKSIISRAVTISRRGIINVASNIGSASIIHRSEISKAATSIMLLSLVMIAVSDTALAQSTVEGAASSLTAGFTRLLRVIFGPIRWILSVIGILIGLWHIFAGVRPDSKRTGTVVILGVLAYAFAPTIVSFVLSIAGRQTFNPTDVDTIDVQ
jgi:type IV secretory pathway VirB2 component (pilin)